MDDVQHPVSFRQRLWSVTSAFILCVLVTYTVASLSQSLLVLTELYRAGADIPLLIVLKTIALDFYGLAFQALFVAYPVVIVAGFVLALPLAALLLRYSSMPPRLLYPAAGAVMMAVVLYAAQLGFYGLSLYAGTRGVLGVAGQMLAGGLGGWVFAVVLEACRGER